MPATLRTPYVRNAMTIAEVLITIVIVTLVVLSIIASLQVGMYFQQSIREENGATRVAADMLDSTRKELFFRLEYQAIEDVVIDNRGTERTDDDILGEVELRFYAPDASGDFFNDNGEYANEVGMGEPLPGGLVMVIAEATVRWNRIGRSSGARYQGAFGEYDREVVLATLLSP